MQEKQGLGQPPQQAFSHSGYRDALLATFLEGNIVRKVNCITFDD